MAFGFFGPIIGIILILLGGFLVFFMHTTPMHQPEAFSLSGIVIGLMFLFFGIFLIFFEVVLV